ncbi:MAG: alpha/beta hydrolase [Candidatus Parcubacteria bacterium]|nr:alpha/beta hydrolase [Burkholderiales bacterium]
MNRSGTLIRPDCSIRYEVAGSGPALVFAHGVGGNHLSWWQQLAHFAPRHTCVAFSHRGFMPSSPVPGETAPDGFADDLAALLEELKLEEVRLVAQSMGGWTCLEYTLRHPAKVRALVMASTSGRIDYKQLRGPGAAEIAQWVQQSPKTAADLEARGILTATGERMAAEQPAAALLYRQISQLTPAEFRTAARVRIMQQRTQSPEVLKQLKIPVLFLAGDEDCVYPSAAGPELAALAPRGQAVRLPRAAHSVYFERPVEFNQIVGDFLSKT